ncbi:hypothetical protein TWF694_003153 [Orbilia ellipsospora]|uniref:Uncharacterized protein n=1 Tax=Orbilia ellipsospora TaxID=2528407 RepID=A0AAV9X0N8_9PEZI
MPPLTNTQLFALSRILPYTPTSVIRQPHHLAILDEAYIPEKEKSKIRRKHILDGIAVYLARTETDISAVAAYRGPDHIKFYYTKNTPFTPQDTEAWEQLKQVIFENEGISVSVHAGYILKQACINCLPVIISRFERVNAFNGELGITSESQEDKFSVICVPNAEKVWEYISTLYGSSRLEDKGMKHIIRGLILNVPRKGRRKITLDSFMFIATLISKLLVNGLSLWRTGERHASACGGSRLSPMDCGIYISKTEFASSDPEGMYKESEELMGRFADAMLEVGVYADVALELAAHVAKDGHLKKCLKDGRVYFEEARLPTSSVLEVSEKPVEIVNKYLEKRKKEAITKKQVEKTFRLPEERLAGLGAKWIECNVHCEIFVLMHMIRREFTSRPGIRKLNVRYGCSKRSCYLCELYVDEIRSRIVGDELEKFLRRNLKSETRAEEKSATGKDEEGNELSNMFSQLKGWTSHPGKSLRSWFSQIGQSEKEAAPKQNPAITDKIESKLNLNPRIPIVVEKDNAENPGYTLGFRQVCAGWRYPADTPDVVKRRMEEKVKTIMTHIYEACRPRKKPEPEEIIVFALTDNHTFPGT